MVKKKKKTYADIAREILQPTPTYAEIAEEQLRGAPPTPPPVPKKEEKGGIFTTRAGAIPRVSGITLPGGRTFLGLSPEEVAEIQRATGTGEEIAAAEQARAEERLAAPLGEAGAFEPLQPAKELPTDISPEGAIPVAGGLASTQALRSRGVIKAIETGLIDIKNPETYSDPMIQQLMLDDIEKEVIKSGEATASSFGAFIEAIPIAGSLARKYAGGLITTPSSQIDDIVANLGTIESQLNKWNENVNGGFVDPALLFNQINGVESDVRWLEAKLKILILQSAELKSAPEEVQNIQTQIQNVYNVIFQLRQRAGAASIQAVQPDADRAFLKLAELKGD